MISTDDINWAGSLDVAEREVVKRFIAKAYADGMIAGIRRGLIFGFVSGVSGMGLLIIIILLIEGYKL